MRSEREIIERLHEIEASLEKGNASQVGKKILDAEKWLLVWVLAKRDDSKPNTDDLLKDILFEIKKLTAQPE